jgi:UDP-N-acetylmuramoylalanine--D-glutamate ligase
MKYLQGLTVLILGLGDSGLAMARWCARCGASDIRVWDSRELPPKLVELREAVPQASFHTGAIDVHTLLDGVRVVLKSPGLAPRDERIAPLLNQALDNGALVQGELDLFNRALADLKAERGYEPKVLAITGTNGKTTTTSLTALVVERTGKRVAMAGNIGPTMLDTLAAALDQERFDEAVDEVTEEADPLPEDPVVPESESVDLGEAAMGGEPVAEEEAVVEASSEPATAVEDEEAPLQLAPPPPKAPVFEHLPEVWVLELSSFQLDEVKGFEPSAAAVLNLTQDHLDWHGDMKSYAAAKARVFGQHAVMVVNRDDPQVEAMVPEPLVVKGAKGRPAKTIHRKVVRFGLDAPQHPGDYGLVTENGMAWLVRAMESDETIKRKKGEEEEIFLQRLMPADALRIRGRHNAANALAALALATAIGCPLAPMLHGLREYTGEPHRVEFIGAVGGIEAFDDSKGTNVGATVAALNGLGADKAPGKLLVILGGDGKGQDFSPLAEPVSRHARAIALIGRDGPTIDAALQSSGIATQRHDTLEAATRWCFEQAQPGDAVLLSPACASLDMFRNYKHRAEVFVAAVQSLAADRGEALA